MSDMQDHTVELNSDAQGQPLKPMTATKSFSKRLQIAADRSDAIPPMNMGRFTHIQRELEERHGLKLSRETVRKWFIGEALPRPDKMLALSRILKVDEGWLAVGATPSSLPPTIRSVPVHSDAAINLVIGMMGMNGVSCAQPDEDDEGPGYGPFFYAIINGRQWTIFVALGQENGGSIRFNGPTVDERATTLAVVAHTVSEFSVFQFPSELIARNGQSHRGAFEISGVLTGRTLKFGLDEVHAIRDFRSLTK